MNNDTHRTRRPLRDLVADIAAPVAGEDDPARRRLLRIRQVVAFVGAAATLIQVIVWLMIALLGGGLHEPWWLWTAVPSAAAVAALTGLAKLRTEDTRS
ncbi:hypothetical protein [Pseudonocardia acaciae]|uniref:hypothetical protein n=1 Tax=Pseudonocardia acaciae TaxID=551276 RepID=UPI000564C149|nr:hypothetical protein [Pseudonocardia acaciae]